MMISGLISFWLPHIMILDIAHQFHFCRTPHKGILRIDQCMLWWRHKRREGELKG
nr:hypothetical protein Iba_chr11dCG1250 [Ipomoea batatas]